MKQVVDQLLAKVEEFKKDAVAQVESGNKAAGARARKASLEIGNLVKEFRKVSLDSSKK